MIHSWQSTKVDDIFKIHFFCSVGDTSRLSLQIAFFSPIAPVVYHVQLAICHARTAIQRKPPFLRCSPSAGLLSLLTNKNQTLLFPADDAAPKVGCQLPLKQREHQGTLQEPGTMPAAPILPGNLYRALFEIYTYIERYRYFLISGNKPTRANDHRFYGCCIGACLTCCLYCFTKQSPGKEGITIPRREQIFPCYIFIIIIILKTRHIFYDFDTAISTHQN